jgi:uncharacterized membrane protein YoaK (UPF0700 family)
VNYYSSPAHVSEMMVDKPNHMPASRMSRLKAFLNEEISDEALLELELMGLALAAGINDATTFPDSHVFVSNQTGNTALLTVGALDIGGSLVDLRNVGFSLGMFIIGGYALGQIGDVVGRRKRGYLLATNLLQTL